MFKLNVLSQVIAVAAATSFLVGCGGGSSSGSSTSDNTDVTGSVFASYVAGAKLEVQDTGGNLIAGPVTTAANGRFTVSVPNAHLKSALFFVATGGTYTDEASGTAGVKSERLAVYAAAGSLSGKAVVNATPSTYLIARLVEKGLTEAKAKEFFEKAFGYLPDAAVIPVDATQDNGDASDAAKLAGVRAAAFSQLLVNMELEPGDHKAFLDVLAEDLFDGDMNGVNAGAAVQFKGDIIRHDMAAQFSLALMDFAKDTIRNKSGLNPGKVGLINFVSKAESDEYYYELTPKGMVKEGKVTFDLTIKTPDTVGSPGTAVSNITPKMKPMMYMAGGHMHSTPYTDCSVTNGNGVAECTAYFLMPSVMGNGDVMGNWDLKFSVAGENEVHFFPKVMMAMGDDTSKLKLMGDDNGADVVVMDGNSTARTYLIYKDSIMEAAGDHTVKFFVATKDSMMSFPALNDTGAVSGPLSSEPVSLEVGIDENNLVAADFVENGIWSATVDNLTNGDLGTVYVQLTVDGVTKKSNGSSILPFKLTPGSM